MPVGPSHTSSKTWKTSAFVGRYRELQIFEDALWKRQAPNDYRVVSLYGIGGQGKTTVMEAYRRRLSEPDAAEVPLATIDLEDSEQRLMIPALISCRNAFREKGVATHLFDIAFARHHALARPGRDIRRDHPELFRFEGGVIGDLVDVANDVFFHFPGAKVLQQMLSRVGTKVAYWYRSQAEPLFEHLSKLNASGIRDELTMFLGADLHHHAAAHPDKRPVVLVDGYERLWADHPGGSVSDAADLWLRRLVEESPGCLFVFAGRRPIRWERVDRDWTDLIQAHEIRPLDGAAIESWFDQAGLAEASIRQRIKESSMGYPLAITLQLASYAKIKARGDAPQLDDFPLSQKDVIDRFMGHLEGALRTIYQIVAVPRHFDRPIWMHLQRAGILPSNEYGFAEIADEVFFQSLDPERRIMHGIVRSHLLDEAEARKPELLHRVRLAVFDYMDRAGSPDPLKREGLDIPDRSAKLSDRDTCLSEAAELLALADPRSFSNWCIQQFSADIRGSKLRVKLLDQAKNIVTDDPSETIGLALLCAETDPFSGDAETLLERALDGRFSLTEKAKEQLEQIVDWLTRFERKIKPRTLASKLRHHIREGTVAALLLSLDQEDTAEALRLAKLVMEGAEKNLSRQQAILAAAALSGDRDLALRVYQDDCREGELLDFDAISCLQNFLMVHRPEWGLASVEAFYKQSDRAQLLCHLAGNKQVFSDCIAGLVGEALALVNDPGGAIALIQQRLTGEQLQAVEDFVSQRAHLDRTQLRHEWRVAEENFASTRWYLRALWRLGWGSERFQQLAENHFVSVSLEFVIADNGEIYIFVFSPLVCNRGTDFYIISEDQTIAGITDPIGLVQCQIPAHLRGHIGQCSRVILVLMGEPGKVLAGDYYLTRTADAADFDRISQELREARYQASERFRKASLDRPS